MPALTSIVMNDVVTRDGRPRSAARKRTTGAEIAAADAPDCRSKREKRQAAHDPGSGGLFRLMTWLSPAYPVGAFAYSSGIEWAVEAGDIADAATLRCWIEAMLVVGSGVNDGIFFTHAYRAVNGGDDRAFIEAAELAASFVPTRERFQETTALGRAFLEVTQAAWPCAALLKLREVWQGPAAYPIAVAAACAGHAIALQPALHGFLTALSSNWISAAMRLVPLGHTESQCVLRSLEPTISQTMRRALGASLDDLGSATFRADIASARHETQYTRLFRS
jgi:urease accessory protein